MARTRYAMTLLAEIPGVRVPFAAQHHVKEFVVDLTATGRTVGTVSTGAPRARHLLRRGPRARAPGARPERPRVRHRGPDASRHRPARRRARGSRPMTSPAGPATPMAGLPVGPKPVPRRFHQARWDEPIIFELSVPGARGILPPAIEPAISAVVGDPAAALPPGIRRERPPALPELGQVHVVRHYDRLSQENARRRPQRRRGPGHLHDEVQPQGQRPPGPEPADRRPPPAPGSRHSPGRPRDHVAAGADARRDLRPGPGDAPARRRVRRDLGERLDDPRLARVPRRRVRRPRRRPRRGHHHDLQPPLERGLREGGWLPDHHAPPGRGTATRTSRRCGQRSRSGRPRC